MTLSKIEDLSVEELMALLFLVGRGIYCVESPNGELRDLADDSEFQSQWKSERDRLRALVKYYPDQEEEKHYLTAMLDAVYGLDPFSEGTEQTKVRLMPLIAALIEV